MPTEKDAFTPVDPLELSRAVIEPYHNSRIATVNDHEVRMSVMTGTFPWHRHPDSDEVFVGIEGELIIEFADREVTIRPGEYFTVPAGVIHRTRSKTPRSVNLTFERLGAETAFLD
jgi:mannose-6-phosphate isomerase-like protein (cupin superfamily)